MGSSAYADDPKGTVYAQLSSAKTQFPNGQECKVVLEKTDAAQGVTIGDSEVTVKEKGVYFISAKAHAGAQKLGLPGEVNLWICKNGKMVSYTMSSQSIDSVNSMNTILAQGAISLKNGDTISIGLSAATSSLGLIAQKGKGSQPSVPSIEFTMFKIEDSNSEKNLKK